MFKQAIIHYPTDEKVMKQICKEIASFRCAATVKYMDSLKLDDDQKAMLIDSLLGDMQQDSLASATAG